MKSLRIEGSQRAARSPLLLVELANLTHSPQGQVLDRKTLQDRALTRATAHKTSPVVRSGKSDGVLLPHPSLRNAASSQAGGFLYGKRGCLCKSSYRAIASRSCC